MINLSRLVLPIAAAALLLSGCQRKNDLAQLDNELIANAADPAVSSALNDQILVDPTLSQQSNRNAVRPPERPVQAQYPPGASPGTPDGPGACGADFPYGRQYAAQLPQPFIVYPGASVTDAAANDRGDCHMRVATFVTPDPPEQVMGFYADRARAGGFSADRQTRGRDQLLGGTAGDAAYVIVVSPRGTGSDVSLIASGAT